MAPDPRDSLYWQNALANEGAYQSALGRGQYDRTRTTQEFGFNQAGALDTSNPYNRATLLQRAYQQERRGMTNSMASRGQLYSGALQRQQGEGTFRYQRDYDSLRRGAEDAFRNITDAEQRAKYERDIGNIGAYGEALGRVQPPAVAPGPVPTRQNPNPAPDLQTGISRAQADYAKRRATYLWNKGSRKGSAWAQIIQYLGYDPRSGRKLTFR